MLQVRLAAGDGKKFPGPGAGGEIRARVVAERGEVAVAEEVEEDTRKEEGEIVVCGEEGGEGGEEGAGWRECDCASAVFHRGF